MYKKFFIVTFITFMLTNPAFSATSGYNRETGEIILPSEVPLYENNSSSQNDMVEIQAAEARYKALQDAAEETARIKLWEKFSASGRQVLNEGWKSVEKDLQDKDDEKDNDDENISTSLPETLEGEKGSCNDINLLEKKTKAPARFTEATLLKAMNEVYRYVQDSEIKKILKETDGIGTAATQATILEELIDSGMLIKNGKNLISSQPAKSLIHALPEKITLPDLTAVWETYFRKIKNSEMSIDEVINYVEDAIRENIDSAQPISIQGAENSNPKKSSKKSNVKCPRCGAPMFLRNGKNGQFWGCSNYPDCKMTANDNNGKPVFKK